MIHHIVSPINTVITGLPYVGKYGGIVNTATRLVQVGEDANGIPIYKREAYPIACGVSAQQCWETGRYQDLIPDDSFRSIFYLEQIDGVRYDGIETLPGHTFHKFTERLRLVGWLNLAKLGISDCAGSTAIELDLVKNLHLKLKAIEDPIKIFKLECQVVNIEPKHKNPFEKYSYDEQAEMWLYPYDYVSLILEVRFSLHENCIDDFEPGVSIDCPLDVEPDPNDPPGTFGRIPANYLDEEQRYSLEKWFGEPIKWNTWLLDPADDYVDLTGTTLSEADQIVDVVQRSKIQATGTWIIRHPELVPTGSGGYKVALFAGEISNSVTVKWANQV